MKVTLCTIPDCLFYGKYCRVHSTTEKTVTRINTFSKKRQKINREYSKLVRLFLKLNPFCKVCGGKSECVHHKRGRIGELLMNTAHFLAVCFGCHRQIEDNPDWAKEQGYSDSRLKI